MQYLLAVFIDEAAITSITSGEQKTLDRDSIAYDEELKRRGHYRHSNALLPPEAGVTVRARNGKFSTTDGPFAETKEHLGGYILVEARDMNEAIGLAANIPVGQFGCVEVRPIMTMPQ
jgi:hypothetical protein